MSGLIMYFSGGAMEHRMRWWHIMQNGDTAYREGHTWHVKHHVAMAYLKKKYMLEASYILFALIVLFVESLFQE